MYSKRKTVTIADVYRDNTLYIYGAEASSQSVIKLDYCIIIQVTSVEVAVHRRDEGLRQSPDEVLRNPDVVIISLQGPRSREPA